MIGVILCALMGANAFDQTFDHGVAAYEQGDYNEALATFERLTEQGVVDATVFYNLGNAYYRAGRVPAAIVNYERALELEPGLEDASENVRRAVSQTQRALSRPEPPEWEQSLLFWHFGLTRETSFAIALGAWAIAWTLLLVRRIRPMPYLRRAAAVALVIALAFGASWRLKAQPSALAVAARERIPVRYGTREDETVRFELYAGDRVAVDKRADGWVRVQTAGGERGWTREEGLLFVGPPYTSFGLDAVSSLDDAAPPPPSSGKAPE